MRRAVVTLLGCVGGIVFFFVPAVASASLSIDGHANAIGSNKPSITTSQTNDVIVLLVTNEKCFFIKICASDNRGHAHRERYFND